MQKLLSLTKLKRKKIRNNCYFKYKVDKLEIMLNKEH